MSIVSIIIAGAVVGCVGIILGFFLGIAGEAFKVETDPVADAIEEVLPGNNCGGCGYAGCSALAQAIAKGEAPPSQCPVGGAAVSEQISSILGVESEGFTKKVAFVKCGGTCEAAPNNYDYSGIKDCAAMAYVPGKGPKGCTYGCLGFGNCIKACDRGAISIIDGVAVVDPKKCGACGQCAAACPRHLIEIVPYDAPHLVQCSSKDKGPVVMKACSAGCIGCGLCARNCPAGAITVTDNVAHIDQDKCTGCGICVEKCPKKCII